MTREIRPTGKLTALKVARAMKRGYLGDGNGLNLQISAAGTKSWVFRYRALGRLREMGLGSFPATSLADARAKAIKCQQPRWEGADPIAVRQAQLRDKASQARKAITFKKCAVEFMENNKTAWRNAKHAKQWEATLETYAYPVIGNVSVQDITHKDVMTILSPIWSAKYPTASRLRQRIELVIQRAIAAGYREGTNPAAWATLKFELPKKAKAGRVKHHPSLPYKRIGEFMKLLQRQEGAAASCLEFLILTAARTNEATGARWDEIDLQDEMWRVPAERMKNCIKHEVPLSPPALRILEEMKKVRQSEFVFPGGKKDKPLSNMAMLILLRRMKFDAFTVHGYRGSFRNWVAERTGFGDVAEFALAHKVSDDVKGAYLTSTLVDKRRELMDQWAQYCSVPEGEHTTTVLPFRGGARDAPSTFRSMTN